MLCCSRSIPYWHNSVNCLVFDQPQLVLFLLQPFLVTLSNSVHCRMRNGVCRSNLDNPSIGLKNSHTIIPIWLFSVLMQWQYNKILITSFTVTQINKSNVGWFQRSAVGAVLLKILSPKRGIILQKWIQLSPLFAHIVGKRENAGYLQCFQKPPLSVFITQAFKTLTNYQMINF